MSDLYISTSTFATSSEEPLNLLKKNRISFKKNLTGKRLNPSETFELSNNCNYLIAGTEDLTEVVTKNNNLKFICRLGSSIENVPIDLLKEKDIKLSNTPAGIEKAVAELTITLILNLLRKISISDKNIRNNKWEKLIGNSISNSIVGIIGIGKIGSEVLRTLIKFNPEKILIYDLPEVIEKKISQYDQGLKEKIECASLENLLKYSDIVTLHISHNSNTTDMINRERLNLMKTDSILINCSRGGLVNEEDLYNHLIAHKNFFAALDTFVNEPYDGPLKDLNNILLSPHIGSLTIECRESMELTAVNEIINFHVGRKIKNEILI